MVDGLGVGESALDSLEERFQEGRGDDEPEERDGPVQVSVDVDDSDSHIEPMFGSLLE